MHKKFEINRTKIEGGCQPGRKVVTHNSKSDWPLVPQLRTGLRNAYSVWTRDIRKIIRTTYEEKEWMKKKKKKKLHRWTKWYFSSCAFNLGLGPKANHVEKRKSQLSHKLLGVQFL